MPEDKEKETMKNARLNDAARRKIVGKLIDHAFGKEAEAIDKMRAKLAEDVCRDLYPPALIKKMRALPEGFLPSGGLLRVSFGGEVDNVRVDDRPVAYCHLTYGEVARTYPASDEKSRRHSEIYAREAALREKMDRARREAASVLVRCRTLRQLVESWPEVEPFARDAVPEVKEPDNKISVTVASLNGKLGL